jgi:hypothetical protein
MTSKVKKVKLSEEEKYSRKLAYIKNYKNTLNRDKKLEQLRTIYDKIKDTTDFDEAKDLMYHNIRVAKILNF